MATVATGTAVRTGATGLAAAIGADCGGPPTVARWRLHANVPPIASATSAMAATARAIPTAPPRREGAAEADGGATHIGRPVVSCGSDICTVDP